MRLTAGAATAARCIHFFFSKTRYRNTRNTQDRLQVQQTDPPYRSSAAAFATDSLWAAVVDSCKLVEVPVVHLERKSLVGIDIEAAVAAVGIRMRHVVVLDSLTGEALALAVHRTGLEVDTEWIPVVVVVVVAYVACSLHLPVLLYWIFFWGCCLLMIWFMLDSKRDGERDCA